MNKLQLQIEDLKNKFVETWPKIIDVNEGWYQLIVDCDKEICEIDPDYMIYQIKEKFGKLRYYHKSSKAFNEETYLKTYSIIKKYENISACTCEATGQPGILMKNLSGWYKTLNPQWTTSSEIYKHYRIVSHDAYTNPNITPDDTMPWLHSED